MAPEASEEEQGKEVEIVPAAPHPEPEQQQQKERDDVTTHQDSEEAAAAEIRELLSKLQLRHAMISQLLGPAGHHRVVTGGNTGQRCLAFMETELSIIAAALTTLSPHHVDYGTKRWLRNSLPVVDGVLHEVDPSRHTLVRRAAQCFHRSKTYELPYSTILLYYLSENICRFRHLLLTSSDLRLTSPQVAEASHALPLVGIDRPAKKILRWLTHQDQGKKMDRSLRVMSIVGPVGIGKTTLAMELRNRFIRHETSCGGRYYFDCNVMAQASRRADSNILLLQDILSQVSEPAATALSSDPSQAKTMQVLVRLVSEHLKDRRYFIVIDDICKASDWEKIKGAFPNNNLRSRILITTRVTSTACACGSDSYDGLVHEMKPLSEMDSERLLLTKALGSVEGCLPNKMKLLCDEILRRCDGIPLFITGMADWLKERLQNWQQEHEDEEEQVPLLPERFQQALCSAFNDFPNDELRKLFLYMSMFPCGYKFDKDRLLSKWIQEGFIDWIQEDFIDWIQEGFIDWRLPYNEQREAASVAFSHLVDRNVICVATDCRNNQHEAEACQWHINYFMQQFLATKAAEMGLVFTTATLNISAAASPATCHGNEPGSRIPRRLGLHHPDPRLPSLLETIDLSQTRSLAVSGAVSGGIPLHRFINLVVLDFEGWENLKNEDLLQVCRSKMLFLSYLSVRNTRVSELPQYIKELRNLQTLDVRQTRITELPLGIFEMSRLLHLLVGGEGTVNSVGITTRLPHDVRHLGELRTLATVDLTEHPARFVRALGYLWQLRVLAITWSFHQSTDRDYCEALLSSIQMWNRLESLTIHCELGCYMEFLGAPKVTCAPRDLIKFKVTAGRFASVPRWIGRLERLAFVQITVCKQGTGDLRILGGLPNLQCLILGLDFIPGQATVIGNEGFIELQRFSIDCPMPWLTFQTGAMPRLTHLEMNFSSGPASEERVPSGITNLPRITEVVLSYSKWCVNSTSLKMTVKAVKEQVAKHRNPIDLFINGVEDDAVQAVDEQPENATRTSSGTDDGPRDDAQAVDEEATGAPEIEITEAES